MADHVAAEGECLISIAKAKGFTRWETIYYHEGNAALRKTRPDPKQLAAGDKVFIPEPGSREVLCETGREHVFQLKRPPQTEVRLVLEHTEGEPMASVSYSLVVKLPDGSTDERSGQTDAEGVLAELVPADATEAELTLKPEGAEPLVWQLKIGDLDPLAEDTGVQDRLRNLGFDLGDEDGSHGPKTALALRAFQESCGLEPTGTADPETLRRLDEAIAEPVDDEDEGDKRPQVG